uniref:Ubiquitin-like domain-containing protein n=1 Tax=Heterorhabditis bacteriophora TaxID=37862 RepID=A0A1I7X4Q2_HETBA
MEMSVVVHNRRNHVKKHLNIHMTASDTVKSVGDKISSLLGVPNDELSIILCGRVLEDSTPIKDLMLGPTTHRIRVDCEDCLSEEAYASFKFKNIYIYVNSYDMYRILHNIQSSVLLKIIIFILYLLVKSIYRLFFSYCDN